MHHITVHHILGSQRYKFVVIFQGYGLSSDQTPNSANPANASLIKRFNQHSTMVLKACDKSKEAGDQPTGRVSNGSSGPPDHPVSEDHPPNKKVRIYTMSYHSINLN